MHTTPALTPAETNTDTDTEAPRTLPTMVDGWQDNGDDLAMGYESAQPRAWLAGPVVDGLGATFD
jgi:hypothetical protein